ncbi:hypothetical protein BC5_0020 [Bacillus phage BC-5]|uniref:Uncharacterized protein n=1 Tax=Bacillus phage BC-5 TaxID=3020389 RepID=A0AAE9Y9Z9_9CAUD|nr:hypothetical protein BC5_0020 [Bacillus phage BC-5]
MEYIITYCKFDYSEPSKEVVCKDLKEVQKSMSENLKNNFIIAKMVVEHY